MTNVTKPIPQNILDGIAAIARAPGGVCALETAQGSCCAVHRATGAVVKASKAHLWRDQPSWVWAVEVCHSGCSVSLGRSLYGPREDGAFDWPAIGRRYRDIIDQALSSTTDRAELSRLVSELLPDAWRAGRVHIEPGSAFLQELGMMSCRPHRCRVDTNYGTLRLTMSVSNHRLHVKSALVCVCDLVDTPDMAFSMSERAVKTIREALGGTK